MTTEAGAPGAEGAGGAGGTPAAGTQAWYSSAPENLRGLAELKGWDQPSKALESYQQLEKMRGVPPERLLTLPAKEDDAEGWAALHGRIGRPDKPEEYGIEGADPELLAEIHKAGLSKRQATALAGVITARAQAAESRSREQTEAQVATDQATLRREWGQEHDSNVRHAQEVVSKLYKAVGYENVEQFRAHLSEIESKIGHAPFMRMFAFLGRGIAEPAFAGAENRGEGFGAMTPGAAKAKISQLEGDPDFQKRLLSEDKSVRAVANAERARYFDIAYPTEKGNAA